MPRKKCLDVTSQRQGRGTWYFVKNKFWHVLIKAFFSFSHVSAIKENLWSTRTNPWSKWTLVKCTADNVLMICYNWDCVWISIGQTKTSFQWYKKSVGEHRREFQGVIPAVLTISHGHNFERLLCVTPTLASWNSRARNKQNKTLLWLRSRFIPRIRKFHLVHLTLLKPRAIQSAGETKLMAQDKWDSNSSGSSKWKLRIISFTNPVCHLLEKLSLRWSP